jgi:tRNA threonylcarbamoyladenosine biosynthesis protein TsaB
MIVLGLDSALGACSAALWETAGAGEAGVLRARRFAAGARGQAEALVPMIEAVRQEAGITWPAVDRLAVTIGPGAFTGLRIGLATARGLALALDRPLIGVTTLEAIAQAVVRAADWDRPPGAVVAAALDARRGQVYFQVFEWRGAADGLHPCAAPAALAPAEAARRLGGRRGVIAGNGAGLIAEALSNQSLEACAGFDQPDAAVLAALAAGRTPPAVPPSPLYLRAPDAKLPLPSGQKTP